MTAQTREQETAKLGAEPSANNQEVFVNFHKTKLHCIIEPNGEVLVSIKPICDAIGLHVDSAWSSIKNDEILSHVHAIRKGRDTKNRKNLMTYLPIQHVHGWLFGIQLSKVSSAAKPKLLQFKKECYQVLFDHFYGKYKVYEHNLQLRQKLVSELGTITAQRDLLTASIRDIKKKLGAIEQEELSGQLRLIK